MNSSSLAIAAHSVPARQKLFRFLQAGLILTLMVSGGTLALSALDNLLSFQPDGALGDERADGAQPVTRRPGLLC